VERGICSVAADLFTTSIQDYQPLSSPPSPLVTWQLFSSVKTFCKNNLNPAAIILTRERLAPDCYVYKLATPATARSLKLRTAFQLPDEVDTCGLHQQFSFDVMIPQSPPSPKQLQQQEPCAQPSPQKNPRTHDCNQHEPALPAPGHSPAHHGRGTSKYPDSTIATATTTTTAASPQRSKASPSPPKEQQSERRRCDSLQQRLDACIAQMRYHMQSINRPRMRLVAMGARLPDLTHQAQVRRLNNPLPVVAWLAGLLALTTFDPPTNSHSTSRLPT